MIKKQLKIFKIEPVGETNRDKEVREIFSQILNELASDVDYLLKISSEYKQSYLASVNGIGTYIENNLKDISKMISNWMEETELDY